ncbi:hypothetical protein [Halorubrum sp. FL23]|uniref:hypothetical protein n=1 Tax=Halorubrum sp. FL23 TaxID=3458704 RepID=UPI004034387F
MTRSDPSRRRFLAGICAAGAATLAGCSGLPFGEESPSDEAPVSLSRDDIAAIERPPSPFPATVPGSIADAHESRARELLDAVPADPSVPNAAVVAKLERDRERALGRLDRDPTGPSPIDALGAWRRRREDAAAVRGAYRAATGGDDGASVARQRQAVREERAALAADLTYRAGSPATAVLAYEPIESLLAECERHVRPRETYPSDPVAEPFRAGEAVGAVERARAAIGDALAIREAHLGGRDDATSRWTSLVAAADGLEASVNRTRGSVLRGDRGPADASDEDLSGTVAQELIAMTDMRVESAVEDTVEATDRGTYATAVIEAGTALAAIEASRAVNSGIRDGGYREAPSASSIRSTSERVREAVREATGGGDPLAIRFVRPAVETVALAADRIEEGYGSPGRAQAELTYADLYVRAVPAATEFVRERLD